MGGVKSFFPSPLSHLKGRMGGVKSFFPSPLSHLKGRMGGVKSLICLTIFII